MKCLFLGGPADGDIRDVEITAAVTRIIAKAPMNASEDLQAYYYRREIFREGDDVFLVYVHDSLKPGKVFGRLAAGYLVTTPRTEPPEAIHAPLVPK